MTEAGELPVLERELESEHALPFLFGWGPAAETLSRTTRRGGPGRRPVSVELLLREEVSPANDGGSRSRAPSVGQDRSRSVRSDERPDPGQDSRDVHAGGVADTRAVDVRDVRVDRQDGVRPAEQVGPTRVTEAGAARSPAGVECNIL